MNAAPVALVLGATTAIGQSVLKQASRLSGLQLMAVSRNQPPTTDPHVTWLQHDLSLNRAPVSPTILLSFGPVGFAASQLAASSSIGRVIAISSASTVFKGDSSEPAERALMAKIEADEQRLMAVCKERSVSCSLFKTTMIYGGGGDANVSRLRELIEVLPVFPVVGSGLRAPVHAEDLGELVIQTLSRGPANGGKWLLEGGERLTYPNLLRAIARARGQSVRILPTPLWLMRLVLGVAHRIGRLRDVNAAMLARQADDLVVDDSHAREQLGWNPRRFSP